METHEIPTKGTHNTFDLVQYTEIEARLIPEFQQQGGKTKHDGHEESKDLEAEDPMLSSS